MRRTLPPACLLLMLCLASAMPAQGADNASFATTIHPIIGDFCLGCHSTAKHKGDLDLEANASPAGLQSHPLIWQRVIEQLADGEMPPDGKPQPSPEQKAALCAWAHDGLAVVAARYAGDPGPVVLRRLSNAEYTYTIRDLTGVDALDPAREFPIDGAAGEGFTNTGQALVMSPSLVGKFLDAGKAVASHAILLGDGIRFSPHVSRRDWTEELLSSIRAFYSTFTDPGGADTVTMQGIVLDKNLGGRLPVEKYLIASLELRAPGSAAEEVARRHNLNARYLTHLVGLLRGGQPSPLLDGLRSRWRTAQASDVPGMVATISAWQKVLFTFNSIGQIGRKAGPKSWMEGITPLASHQDVHLKLAPAAGSSDIVVTLSAEPAEADSTGDMVVWHQPKLLVPGQPPMALRDVRSHLDVLLARRDRRILMTTKALDALALAPRTAAAPDPAALAATLGVDLDALGAWLSVLGLGTAPAGTLELMAKPLPKSGTYDFITGWGSPDTPSLVANSSDQQVRIPGIMKPHGVAIHPSPTLTVAVGWRSPIAGLIRVSATITHAHPECGNGVTWAVDVRRGTSRQRLATGDAQGATPIAVGPFNDVPVRPGDLISVLVSPRGGMDAPHPGMSHACALTDVEFTLSSSAGAEREWSLTRDVSSDVLAGNPHADRAGHPGVWSFYTEPLAASASANALPAGCALSRWLAAGSPAEKHQLAEALQALLTAPAPAGDGPDAQLRRQLISFTSPLCAQGAASPPLAGAPAAASTWGVDPSLFGKRPDGSAIDDQSICLQAPGVIRVRLPAELVAGAELVTTGTLEPTAGANGSVRLQATIGAAPAATPAIPVIVTDSGTARRRIAAACEEFRELFPASLCYTKIVPVDEVITLSLFYREDDQLCHLMLDDAQRAQLDRLWDQLHYIGRDALLEVDAFEQLWQYATQDGDPSTLEPLRKPLLERAAAFRQALIASQPAHLDAVLAFAEHAYRRPLSASEKGDLRTLYQTLRERELPHEEAIRLLIAKVLVSPPFLYRAEKSRPGTQQTPVDAWELASRLSYFLWSSEPDAELLATAATGRLLDADVLAEQMRRMLRDGRIRRMAIEFGCAWLHITDFDELDEKSEKAFPEFLALRGAMYEEAIRFLTDYVQADRPVISLLDADYGFLNEELARYYAIPDVHGPEWRRVEGLRAHGRGGILGLAATLAKHSGASRTSPILRGNWISEVLLGERLPRPPKDVPPLPTDEANETLSVRQLTEKHASDPRCNGCHVRIDAFGFALEGFDAIGHQRTFDIAKRPIDTVATVRDGTRIDGLDGLRGYLLGKRREAFLRQLSRKLLGFALGRSVQLSDQPLLDAMVAEMATDGSRIGTVLELVVRSRQFRDIRGRDAVFEQ
jgi:hypothetical protein